MPDSAPLVVTLQGHDVGYATATDDSFIIGEAPFAGTVTGASYTPEAAITGAASNHRAIRIRNKGAAGAGTTVVAELAFDNGVNATAYDEKTLTLSATAADLVVAAGDILECFSEAVGTGLADPGGIVRVEITRS